MKYRILHKPGYKIVAITAIVLGVSTFEYHDEIRQKAGLYHQPLSQKETKIAEKMMEHGSPEPVKMAQAVAKTKRPALMAAIAITESNGNPKAIGKSKERGAFQVLEKHWGRVHPSSAMQQALHSERILDELIAEKGSTDRAVMAYNGTGYAAKRYQKKVLTLAKQIERDLSSP